MEIFRKRFIELIKVNKTKQSELAKYLNIERQGITNYKNGTSVPSLETFKKICQYFDVPAGSLLGLEDYAGNRINTKNYIGSINNSGKIDFN